MSNVEWIENIDMQIDRVQKEWADQVIELINDKSAPEGSFKYKRKFKALSNKYAPIIADLLIMRQDAYQKQVKIEEAELESQFENAQDKDEDLLYDNGRPKDMIWKDGGWVKIDRKD